MNKLLNIFKLMKYVWDHSDQVLKMLETMQSNLPQLVDKLCNCATELETAARKIHSAEMEISDTFQQVGNCFDVFDVPKLDITTSGFMDVLFKALTAVLPTPPPQPDQNIKDDFNKIRLINQLRLDGQVSPFQPFISYLNLRGQVIEGAAESAGEALFKTSSELREFAKLLKAME